THVDRNGPLCHGTAACGNARSPAPAQGRGSPSAQRAFIQYRQPLPQDHRSCARALPSLHTLAKGIDRDRDAVIAGLTLPWSSGVVEGHVNRIKMLKRQMHGRAGFDLLRKRVLLT
ncbi:MAG TPA: hypothetical protein VIU94_07580, partial [Streptomyces sp.]